MNSHNDPQQGTQHQRVDIIDAAALSRLDLDEMLKEAENRAKQFADDHKVTVDVMSLEFCI